MEYTQGIIIIMIGTNIALTTALGFYVEKAIKLLKELKRND